MEDFILSALLVQGASAVVILVFCAADAVAHRLRQPRYWAAPAATAPAFPESVYDRQDAAPETEEEDVLPRAA